MKKPFSLFLLIFLAFTTVCFSQIKLLMLNGTYKEVKQYEPKDDILFYKNMNDPKDKMRKLDRYDVFSATNPEGVEDVIYDPDSIEGDPSVAEVRKYIRGEQYGMAAYHKPMNKVGGLVVGFGCGAAGFYGPAGVFLYSLIVGRSNPKHIPETTLIEPEVFNSEEFKAGYNKYARNKKIQQSLIFGGIGFAVGFTFFAVVLNN